MFPAIQKAESLENIFKNFSSVFKDFPCDFGQTDRDIINKKFWLPAINAPLSQTNFS